MSTTTKTYRNEHNNGQERVRIGGGKISISSDWGSGWSPWRSVSVTDLRRTLQYTSAPAEIRDWASMLVGA